MHSPVKLQKPFSGQTKPTQGSALGSSQVVQSALIVKPVSHMQTPVKLQKPFAGQSSLLVHESSEAQKRVELASSSNVDPAGQIHWPC